MKNKRGFTMMDAIIALVCVALFLIIMVLFFGGIPWFDTIDREACHNSIIQRATFNFGPLETGKTTIPLKCKTEKICITESGEDCEEFPKPTIKNPVTEVKISSGENSRVAVMDQLAESMYQCHKMLGEGKVNFMSREALDKNYCLVCTRIAFDDDIKQEVQQIPYGAFYRHLQQKTDPDGKSYLSYIYPGWESWEQARTIFDGAKDKKDSPLKNTNFEDWAIDLSQEDGYAIIVQIQEKGRWEQYVYAGGAFIGTAAILIAAPFTLGGSLALLPAAVGIGVVGGAAAGGVTAWYTNPDGFTYSPPTIYPYDIPTLQGLQCSSFETAP